MKKLFYFIITTLILSSCQESDLKNENFILNEKIKNQQLMIDSLRKENQKAIDESNFWYHKYDSLIMVVYHTYSEGC